MLPPEEFTITVGRHRDTVTVAVTGEVDTASGRLLREHLAALCEDRPATLVLDLSGVTFLDSSGVALLLSLWRTCRRDGVELLLARVSPVARRVLEVCGVAEQLPLGLRGG
jgi:anti-sigma B factor antagonist